MPKSSLVKNIIRVLPEPLINKIAAGEVVERPSSVVKELLENAIDAGATDIQVTVKNGGKDLISIIDNGIGMSEADAKLSFERHATSKIDKEEDLFCINTLGFRGEALAAIASVSNFELLTCDNQKKVGTRVSIKGGSLVQVGKIGFPKGTKVTVENLFYNTPARQKFLKTTSTEIQHIQLHLIQKSLSYPNIHFRLTHNQKILMNLPSDKGLEMRIEQLFGEEFKKILMPVSHKETYLKLDGFISFPSKPRTSRRWQYVFVNGRNVKSLTINHGVYNGYGTFLGKSQHPAFFLNILVDPSEIDVNVHPAKTEIRFRNSHLIHTILVDQISRFIKDGTSRKFFGQDHLESKISTFGISGQMELPVIESNINQEGGSKKIVSRTKEIDNKIEGSQTQISQNLSKRQIKSFFQNSENNFEKNGMIENFELYNKKNEFFSTKKLDLVFQNSEILNIHHLSPFQDSPKYISALGQFQNNHIVAEDKKGLKFFDLRMLFERLLYDIYMEALKQKSVIKKTLNTPILIDFSMQESKIINQYLKDMDYAGFSISQFGKNTFSVYSSPEILSEKNLENTLREFIYRFKLSKEDNVENKIFKEICFSVVSNIKSNFFKKLNVAEMNFLLAKWEEFGEPIYSLNKELIFVKMSKNELESLF